MTDANNTPSPAQDLDEIRIEHPFIEFARMYIRNAAAVIGLLIFLIIVFAALFAPIPAGCRPIRDRLGTTGSSW